MKKNTETGQSARRKDQTVDRAKQEQLATVQTASKASSEQGSTSEMQEQGNKPTKAEKEPMTNLTAQAVETEKAATKMEAASINQAATGEKKMADNETARDISRGLSESMERAESAGRSMTQTARGVLEDFSNVYGTFLSVEGARRMAELYIETNQKLANEALEFSRKWVELSAGSARKFWQVAEEQRSESRKRA